MKLIASPWRSTPLIASRGCKKSEVTPRRSSATSRSNAAPTRTRTASTCPRGVDGDGRSGRNSPTVQGVAETRLGYSSASCERNTRKSRCGRILAPHHVGANPSGTHHSKLPSFQVAFLSPRKRLNVQSSLLPANVYEPLGCGRAYSFTATENGRPHIVAHSLSPTNESPLQMHCGCRQPGILEATL